MKTGDTVILLGQLGEPLGTVMVADEHVACVMMIDTHDLRLIPVDALDEWDGGPPEEEDEDDDDEEEA